MELCGGSEVSLGPVERGTGGQTVSYTTDNNEATRDETPVPMTTARPRLEPVPPDGASVTIVEMC